MRVLLVEDERRLATAVKLGLQAEGFVVDLAHNGEDGLHLAREGGYDAVVLDIMLPRLSGYKVCERLRAEDNWVPILEKDVDGANSLPLRLDGEVPNLGKFAACRRVARTIYLGSAPTPTAANRGIEDRRVKLGCVMPGEPPPVFGDALRRLAAAAAYLYQDGPCYWYSTQPTVTKLAEDRAELLKRDPDKVVQELEKRLRDALEKKGDFNRVHPMLLQVPMSRTTSTLDLSFSVSNTPTVKTSPTRPRRRAM